MSPDKKTRRVPPPKAVRHLMGEYQKELDELARYVEAVRKTDRPGPLHAVPPELIQIFDLRRKRAKT
jgi:hypothetical protein